jgi:hypothetical protein
MITPRAFIFTSALAMLLALPAYAQEPPTRHLVYSFTMGVQSESRAVAVAAPEMPAGGAMGGASSAHVNDQGPATKGDTSTESSGVSSDGGTITVDVFTPQADGGLHVRVSEASRHDTTQPVDCIVYPSTSVNCGTRISNEAALVLSTLSPTFFQPATLDAKNHWSEGANVPGLSLDFTASAPNGSVVSITEERNQKFTSGTGGTLRGLATFTYDTVKRVSTNVKDHETLQQGESGQSSNLIVDITATLTSDSGPAKN